GTRLTALGPEVVVSRIRPKSCNGEVHTILAGQRIPKHDLIPADLGEMLAWRRRGLNHEGYRSRNIGTGRLPIEVREIVVVDAGVDGPSSSVAQVVVQNQLRF